MNEILNLLAHLLEPLRLTLFTVSGEPVSAGSIIELLLVLAGSTWLGGVVERNLRELSARHGSIDRSSVMTVARLMRWSIFVLGALIGLALIGVPVTHLAIMVSALSVGIGFGLQTIVNNLVAGLILLSERSVRVGDFVALGSGDRGVVRAISMRSTRIITPDGVYVLVPNATLIDGTVKNLSLDARGHRERFSFGVAYGSDIAKVAEVVSAAARALPYTQKDDVQRAIEVGISGFGEFALTMELVVWVRLDALMEPYRVTAAYLAAISDACTRNGIVMPGPAYDVNVRSIAPVALAPPLPPSPPPAA
ncbi:MAG: mechanosensitive ion channel [Burkholderiaceae bacterium]